MLRDNFKLPENDKVKGFVDWNAQQWTHTDEIFFRLRAGIEFQVAKGPRARNWEIETEHDQSIIKVVVQGVWIPRAVIKNIIILARNRRN